MSATKLLLFREADKSVPFLDWFKKLPNKVKDKCVVRMRRLAELGHELRRPEADILRNGIYELRVGYQGVNYRILYFFHGGVAAVVSHGLAKEREVSPAEIDRAVRRMRQFLSNPVNHTAEISL